MHVKLNPRQRVGLFQTLFRFTVNRRKSQNIELKRDFLLPLYIERKYNNNNNNIYFYSANSTLQFSNALYNVKLIS